MPEVVNGVWAKLPEGPSAIINDFHNWCDRIFAVVCAVLKRGGRVCYSWREMGFFLCC